MKNIFLWIKSNAFELLLWLSLFVLLTISNASYDLILSVELSAILTFGMLLIATICRLFLLPKLYNRMPILFFLAILLVSGMAWISSKTLDATTTAYFSSLEEKSDKSLLDIQLPSETKPFFDTVNQTEESRLYLSSGWKSFILYFGSFLFVLVTYYRRITLQIEEQQSLLMQEKIRMELNFLRSQINPHFLFNALNNIYSMIYTGDQHAADSVLSLSEMLRYVTYESKESRILLSGEISYLENYIEFQRFNYEGNVNVSFEKKIENDSIYIAPMLLQPFVENAFKYSGIGQDKNSYIKINLFANVQELKFQIENSKKQFSKTDSSHNGIGIENVRKRLDLMYPRHYTLDINESDFAYELCLIINLKENTI